jgi:hypothetical protein
MAKVSFDQVEAEAVETPSTAVVVKEAAHLAVKSTLNDSNGSLIGEWGVQDTRLPRINLVNKSGELADNFTPGTYTINREHQLNSLSDTKDKSNPVKAIAVRMVKQYRENTPYESETPGRIFNTAAEVRSAGGVVSRAKGANNFSEMAHIEFLVEAPEGLNEDASGSFCHTIGGKQYARVVYTATGTAFGAVAVTLASSLLGHLSSTGLIGGMWDLGSTLVRDTKNSWWQPTLRSAGLVTPEAREEIANLV